MIARIRRGNDFHVAWKIKRGGVAENLENVTDIKLERTIYGVTTEHTLFTVSGDTITAEIPAEVQTHNGQYKLTLSYELVDTGMSDDDRKCKVAIYAFAIVDPLGPADDLLTVDVASDVSIGFKGDEGLSAYQVWLEDGNVGTEDDYFAYLRQPATDAAASVSALEQTVSDNEALRVTAEQDRVDAELLRIGAESARNDAEVLRDSAEDDRIEAEGIRNTNETGRINAESDRVDAEVLREQAEAAREEAEGLRQTNTTTAIQDAGEATTAANTAAGLATEAATTANTAAGDANDAATAANTAAGLADTARTELTTAVNTKLGEADDKIEEMDTTLSTYDGRVTQVESDISQLAGNLTGVLSSDLDVNYLPNYIPTGDFSVGDKISYDVVISTSSLFHAILTVKKGDTFVLNARGGNRPRIYCFVDINDIVLEVSDGDPHILIEHVITAPTDGKLIFNSFNTVITGDDTVKMGLKGGYSRLDYIENQLLSEYAKKTSLDAFAKNSIVSGIIKNTNPELLLNSGTNIWVTGDVGDVAVIEERGEAYTFYSNTFEVEEKDIFVITVRGGGAPLAYAILDENDVILEKSGSYVTLIDYLIEIPENGSKLIINSYNTNSDGTVLKPSVKVLGSSLIDASKGQLATLTLGRTATPPDLTNFGKTLTFGGTVFVFHQNKRYTINSGTVVDLSPLSEGTGRMVLLDTKTNDLYLSDQTRTHNHVKKDSVLIAIAYQNMGKWLMNINCPYTIDGEIYNPYGEPTIDGFEVGISYRSFVTLESINTANGNYIESDKASMTPMIPSSSLIKATVEDGFNFHRVVLYDNEGAFIGTVLKNSQSTYSSDFADSSFVRLKVMKDDSTAFTSEELELSKPTITRLQQEFFESRNVSDKEIQLYKNGKEVFPVSLSKDDLLTYSFSTNRLLTNYPESNFAGIDTPESDFTHATVTAEDVYILFDAMVTEHPEYISREQIGLSTNGVPMYVYDFKPTRPSTGSESIKPFPKVILGGAIHGGENMAVYTLYHFFFNMVTNWEDSETLEYLRHSVNFRVIPVQNPEDFNNKKYVGIEGINLNRDFDFRWTESSDSGSTPFQRIESRNLRDFLFENTDALFHTDCHVRGGYPVDDNKLIWVATNGEQIIPTSAMIEYLTREWLFKYPSLQIAKGEFAGYTTSELGAKTIRSYTQHVVGIPSFLWEGFQSSTTLNEYQNEDVVNVNLQSLGQYIVSILKYYQNK